MKRLFLIATVAAFPAFLSAAPVEAYPAGAQKVMCKVDAPSDFPNQLHRLCILQESNRLAIRELFPATDDWRAYVGVALRHCGLTASREIDCSKPYEW